VILLLNVFLTSKRHSSFDRGRFSDVDALSAFRYMLRSLTDLQFSQVYIFAELDADCYSAHEAAMLQSEVETLFEGTPLDFRSKRLLALRDWQKFIATSISTQNEPVFYSGNHDHVFMDGDTRVLDDCLSLMARLRGRFDCVSLIMSHWAEYFSYRSRLQLHESFGFVHTSSYRDAMQVLTPKLLENWFFKDSVHLSGDAPIRRTEDLGWQGASNFPQIIPGRELFRHLDGGSHFGVRIDNQSPLRIPPGLLEGAMKLAYIAEPDLTALRRYQAEGYCCVSPHFPSLACEADGVDFHWLPDEIPSYMLRFATEVVNHGQIDMDAVYARDAKYAAMLKDMLPLSAETLGRLAPMAIRTLVGTEPPTLAQPDICTRRTESVLTLKLPRGQRQLGVIVIASQGHLPEKRFWAELDTQVMHSVYVWRQERSNTAWHVQASANQMTGLLYNHISGIYSYLFDFASNEVAALRQVLHDMPCDQIAILNPDALAFPSLAAWLGRQVGGMNSLMLGSKNDAPVMLAFSVSKLWLLELLDIYPNLYAAESMSLIEVLVHAAHHGRRLPKLNLDMVDLSGYQISAPAISLLS